MRHFMMHAGVVDASERWGYKFYGYIRGRRQAENERGDPVPNVAVLRPGYFASTRKRVRAQSLEQVR
jgi:hypothetical protein